MSSKTNNNAVEILRKKIVWLRLLLLFLLTSLLYLKRHCILSLLSIMVYKVSGNPEFAQMAAEVYRGKYEYFHKLSQQYYKLSLSGFKSNLDRNLYTQKQIPQIHTLIGTYYHCGRGVEQNYALAEQWYQKAIAANYTTAELYFGNLVNSKNNCSTNT